ncbi:MAG: hypothetical protein EOS65_02615 [Mesorhizobium sp.]|uniref:hypothetical protein n=1 Tax=Mesorhizobium sp. TaxID=1871066 RepID=UPI000FE4CC53|nr:hypothetical protein [Mesorhizobium sp.]RWF44287.1 MAG: hypothetical protein EOS65_02615 [Mesorhizobium sp.]
MANNVTIGGVTVDADDPCALATALTNVRLQLIAGGTAVMFQHGETRTQFTAANLSALEAEIARNKDLCGQSTGGRKARFAMRAGFRRIP